MHLRTYICQFIMDATSTPYYFICQFIMDATSTPYYFICQFKQLKTFDLNIAYSAVCSGFGMCDDTLDVSDCQLSLLGPDLASMLDVPPQLLSSLTGYNVQEVPYKHLMINQLPKTQSWNYKINIKQSKMFLTYSSYGVMLLRITSSNKLAHFS